MPCHYDPEKYYSRYPSSPRLYMFSPFLDTIFSSRYFLHFSRYYTNWTRLLLTCVIPLVALVVFNTKIFLGIRCLAFWVCGVCTFSRYFALNRTSSFLWYFVTPLINIDTADFLSLGALTYSSFHPNGMSNSPMNERNNSLPSEFNSNTQNYRQDTTLPLSQTFWRGQN